MPETQEDASIDESVSADEVQNNGGYIVQSFGYQTEKQKNNKTYIAGAGRKNPALFVFLPAANFSIIKNVNKNNLKRGLRKELKIMKKRTSKKLINLMMAGMMAAGVMMAPASTLLWIQNMQYLRA